MGVIIGSARIDEFGKLSGGQAGDQTGKEVSTQDFYVHSKGYYVLRPKSKAEALGDAMYRACCNKNFGYDQGNRLDCLKHSTTTTTPTECDCSSLVRLCIKEVFGKDVGNFTTFNEAQVLEASGLFHKRIPYEHGKTILYKGDVLVTKTKGHTVIVVKADQERNEEIEEEIKMASVSKEQQAAFLARIIPLCQKQASEHGYHLFPSVAIAQACLESGWGTAKKMIAANALMGVKVGKSAYKFGKVWHGAAYKTGTTEYYDGKNATKIVDYFRQYASIEDSICDYMDMLLHCERYRGCVDCRSPEESIKAIVKGDYATGPDYAKKVMSIINTHNLTRFDHKGIINDVCPYPMPELTNKKSLKRGSKGDTVKALQWALNVLINAGLYIDGNFGPATEEAVRLFQKKANLTVDGIAGVQTWTKIRSML